MRMAHATLAPYIELGFTKNVQPNLLSLLTLDLVKVPVDSDLLPESPAYALGWTVRSDPLRSDGALPPTSRRLPGDLNARRFPHIAPSHNSVHRTQKDGAPPVYDQASCQSYPIGKQ